MATARLSDVAFVGLVIKCKTLAEAASATGLKATSVQQRCSSLRQMGYVIPRFGSDNAATKEPTDEQLAELAAAMGLTLEQYKAAAAEQKARSAQMGEKIRGGRAAAAASAAAAAATANAPAEGGTPTEG